MITNNFIKQSMSSKCCTAVLKKKSIIRVLQLFKGNSAIFTPHAQRERGKVIGCVVSYTICLWTKKIFESYFRDRLTFSNISSRTSLRIYRLALPLRAPETLSSLSKSRTSIFNVHLTLFLRGMMSHNSIGKYRHLV